MTALNWAQRFSIGVILLTCLSGCLFGSNQHYFEITKSTLDSDVVLNLPQPAPLATPFASLNPVLTPTPASAPNAANLIATDDGPYEIAQNQTLEIQIAELISNDRDLNQKSFVLKSTQNLSTGTLSHSSADSKLIYQPAHDYLGPVSFEYTIQNSEGATASAHVAINVRRPAVEVMYGHSFSKLYRYNPSDHSQSFLAEFKLASGTSVHVYDIAIDSNGVMFGVDGTSLYNIDASSGLLTRIDTSGIASFGNINGLTALSDGRIVISGNGVAIYNLITHSLSTLLAPGSFESSGDIIALPDGNLYLVATTPRSGDRLVKINPNTGVPTVIGLLNHVGVYGLGYAYHVLYGFAWDGQVFQINPDTGAISNAVSTSLNWGGATTNPVLW